MEWSSRCGGHSGGVVIQVWWSFRWSGHPGGVIVALYQTARLCVTVDVPIVNSCELLKKQTVFVIVDPAEWTQLFNGTAVMGRMESLDMD